MTSIAELGIAVNSESAVQAASDLDKLVDSGKGAEDSAKRVEAAWQKAVSGISNDTSQIVKELQLLNARQDATAQLMAKISQTVSDASVSFVKAATSSQKFSTANDQAAKSADQAAKSTEAQRAQLEALLGKIDPLTKKLNDLASQETALAKARESGLISQASYDTYNQKLQDSLSSLAGVSVAQREVGETADQAKARILALATATVESSRSQLETSKAYDATTASTQAAERAQLDLLAAQNRTSRMSTETTGAQQKTAEATRLASAATDAQAAELEQLLGKIDPTTAALARLGEQQRALQKFKEQGILDPATFTEYNAKLDKASAALAGFDASTARTGNTAKQTAQALRTLPAQISDITVSLAAGQQPFTVFLQQGAQIKDQFGGVGAALKGVGGYALGLINPFTLAAAAVAAVGLAYKGGSDETTAFNQSLLITGNYAGTTSSALAAMAQNVGSAVGTTGAAAKALDRLASGGKIASTSFEMIATSALKFQEATGRAASETIGDFEKIAKEPAKSLVDLNEKFNFLTASVYEQVRALEKNGDTAAAADIAEAAYSQALDERSAKIKQSLGTVETAWNEVSAAAKRGWDSIFDIGREENFQAKIDKIRLAMNNSSPTDAPVGSFGINFAPATVDDEAEAQKKIQAILQKEVDDQKIAREQMFGNAAMQQATKYYEDIKSQLTSTASKGDQLAEALKKARFEIDVARSKGYTITAAEQAKLEAQLRDKFKKPAKAATIDLTSFNDAGNALKALETTFQNSLKVLDAAQKAGLISDQEYALQKSALIDKEKTDVQAAYQGEIAALEAVSAKSSTTSAQRIQVDQKIADSKAKMVDALKKLDADQEVLSIQANERREKERKSIEAYGQALTDSLKRTQDSLDLQLAGYGLGNQARQQLQEILKIRQEYEDKFDKLERDHRLKRISDNEYDAETKLLQESLDQRLAMQQGYYDKEAALRSDWMNGASRAFANYIDETKDIAGQTEGLFSDALHGVEDAFVDAATTGKLSFKDLADSIIADLARIVAKAYIVTPLLAALGIGGDSAGGTGGGVLSGLGGGGVTSWLSNASSVVSVAGSKFGDAVLSGWSGGDGLLGGLEGALGNGADYLKTAITSAFTTGSASATAAANLSAESLTATLSNSFEGFGAQFGTGLAQGGSLEAVTQSTSALTSGLSTLSTALSVIGTAYSVFSSFQDYGIKGGATTAGFAGAGALVGSFVGPIGTAAGAAIGSVLGSFVSSKLFGGSGEKYPDLSTSAQGTYSGGQYNTGGIVQGWQTNAPKYGDSVDAQLDATVNKFSKTLGDLYTAFGASTQVYAYDMLQVRKTSGKYSTTFGATIDGGGADDLNIHQQFSAADAAEALQHNYDDIMGTFLAKAIVSSKSLPDYFRAQFTDFADSWDTTADEVIKAIEGIFTRFNGVNDALALINVNGLKLDNTGLMASDSILNMVASIADLDTTTATAKEKVDALNTAVGTYYKAFFSADEQFADLTKSLQGAFGGFGLELPDTRAAYRSMVEDIDVTTSAGQAMFATLVGLATNADSYYSNLEQKAKDAETAAAAAQQAAIDAAAEAAQKIIDTLMGNVTSAESALERAISAQKASINDMLETANSSVSDLTGISTDLSSALKSLRGDSDSAVKMLRAQAQATLQNALATARAGGSLAGVTGLSDALDTISNNSTDLYSSLEDFNRDQGRTANVVSELEKLNGKQLTSAEKTVKALQDQLGVLDDQLEYAKAQLDAVNGVDNSVKTVAEAVNAMNAAVVAALGAITGTATGGTATNNGTLIDSVYQSVLGRSADSAGKAYWQGELSSGRITYAQLEQAIRNAAIANGSLAGYATGGLITGPGTGKSDSILARLSAGEYVLTSEAVSKYGTDLLDQMNGMQVPAFASGGPVMNVSSPMVAARAQPAGNGDSADSEGLKLLNKRLGNLETFMERASIDLRQMNTVGVQVSEVLGTVQTKEVA